MLNKTVTCQRMLIADLAFSEISISRQLLQAGNVKTPETM